MKVLFSKSFEDELKRIDGSAIITKVVLEYDTNIYSPSNVIPGLLSSKVSTTEAQDVTGIWDNSNKVFNLNFNVPSRYIINDLASDDGKNKSDYYREANVIKFLWRNDEIAFILIDGYKSGKTLPIIDFSQINNLFSVQFPEWVKTKNVETVSLSDDTEFLEGGGAQSGENIIRVHKRGEDECTVSKNSFIHYCYIYPTEGTVKKDLPFLDIYGRNTADSYIYKQVVSIELTSPFVTKRDGTYTVYGLPITGGTFDFTGTVTYNEYHIEDSSARLVGKLKTAPLDTFSGLELVCETKNGLTVEEINNYTKSVKFSEWESDKYFGNSATFAIEYYSYDPTSNFRDIVPVKSNEVKLVQGSSDSSWRINYVDTTFYEDDIPVIMFEWDETSPKEISIITTDNIGDSRGENFMPLTIDYEDTNLKTFFQIKPPEDKNREYPEYNESRGCYEYVLEISPKNGQKNNNNYWLPRFPKESESRLSKVTVGNGKHSTSFYVVQKKKFSKPELYKTGSSTKVKSLILTEKSDTTYFVTSGNIGESTEYRSGRRYWKLIGSSSKLLTETYNPQYHQETIFENEILRKTYNDKVEDGMDQFYIYTNDFTADVRSEKLGDFILYDIPEAEVNVNQYGNTDWRYEINISRSEPISVSIKGQEPEIDFAVNSDSGSYVEGIGFYNLIVKSNFPYSLTFKTNNVHFTPDNTKTYTVKDNTAFYNSGKLSTIGFVVSDINPDTTKKILLEYKSTEPTLTKTGTFEIKVSNTGKKTTGLLINPETLEPTTRSRNYYLGKDDIYPVILKESTNLLVNSPGNISITAPDDMKAKYDITTSTALNSDLTGYMYSPVGPNSLRPNQEIQISRKTKFTPTELYPVSPKYELSLDCGGDPAKYCIFEGGIEPEFVIFDDSKNNITKGTTLPVSTFSGLGSSFTLLSRYRLAGEITFASLDSNPNYSFNLPDSCIFILARNKDNSVYEEISEQKGFEGWWEYKFTVIKKADDTTGDRRISIKSFIPVGDCRYLDGESSSITSVFSESESGPTILDLTQNEVNRIVGVFEKTYLIDYDFDVIFPDKYDEYLNSGFIVRGSRGESLSAYNQLNLIPADKAENLTSLPDNLYRLICRKEGGLVSGVSVEDIFGYSNSFVSKPKEDVETYNISLELLQRQSEVGNKILTLSDSYVIDSLRQVGTSKEVGFSINVSSSIEGKEYKDKFTIINTQDGVEYALVMSKSSSTLKALCGKGNVRDKDNLVFFDEIIDSKDSADYLDFTVGSLSLSSEFTDKSVIDASRLDITVLKAGEEIYSTKNKKNTISAPFELLENGRSSYSSTNAQPNIRLFCPNETQNEIFLYTYIFELYSDKELDASGKHLLIAKGSINITKKPYSFKIIEAPEDVYINADGNLIPGSKYIDGTKILFTTDCKRAYQESYGNFRYSFTPMSEEVLSPIDPLEDIYSGKITKTSETDRYITCGLDFIVDPRYKADSEIKSELKIGVGTSDDRVITIHQGYFTPVYLDGEKIDVDLDDFDNYVEFSNSLDTWKTITKSVRIMSLDYKYSSTNQNYNPEKLEDMSNGVSVSRLGNNLKLISERWRIKEVGKDELRDVTSQMKSSYNTSTRLSSVSLGNGNYDFRFTISGMHRLDYILSEYKNKNYTMYLECEVEYKTSSAAKFKYTSGNFNPVRRDNIIYVGFKMSKI